MIIEKITNKNKYMDLLLLADPDEEIVNQYIDKCDMFGLFEKNEILAQICILKIDDEICELKNISTSKSQQGKGYASLLINHVFNEYKNNYKKMIVGTTENMIPFYVLKGFNKYYKTCKNFFTDNYSEEVWDDNLHCIDMYYYYKDLTEDNMYWNKNIPEFSVTNLENSLNFYKTIGFKIEYERPENKFAFISLGQIQFMLQELTSNNKWELAPLFYPFGNGINFQLEVSNLDEIYYNLKKNNYKISFDIEENWYRQDNKLLGNKEFLIQDPDGYLLRFSEDLGEKPIL